MTLIQAISTGRLYKRSNGPWLKSEREHWPIRNTGNGSPYPLSENDIKANDWVIDIRPKDAEYGWIYSFSEWETILKIKDRENDGKNIKFNRHMVAQVQSRTRGVP